MSKVMIDTNVWVDVVLNRPQFVGESKGAIMACLEEGDDLLVAATSLKDVYCFAVKSAGSEAGYKAVQLILEIAQAAQVDGVVCRNALALERPDYEDGIVAACLLAEGADAIVTRDEKSFDGLGVAKYSPHELLAARGYEAVGL